MAVPTFTLTQQQQSVNVFIFPNGNLSGCTDLTPYGNSNNWDCVDDNYWGVQRSDEDTTYVYNNIPTELSDLYELPNQSLSGTINYIQVYTRAKSHLHNQGETGIYKIICSPDSTCTNVFKSGDKNLVTNYSNYSYVWSTNPDDSAAWEWADVDALCIGLECSSPTIGVSSTLVLTPNAAGDSTELTPSANTNWECAASFGNSSTIYRTGAVANTLTDLYNIANPSVSGTISKIAVFIQCKKVHSSANVLAREVIKIGGTEYTGDDNTLTTSAKWYSYEWELNPDDSSAWEFSDINDLQIGVEIEYEDTSAWNAACYTVYAIVYYDEDTNPEVRTTQCYAKVNYTPDAIECLLNKPSKISFNHDRNVKMLNFWDGTREVYDLSRNSKSIVMTGEEFSQTGSCTIGCPCERIKCVRGMGIDGSSVTIAGFTQIRALANGIYKIRSFGWKKISDKPIHFDWILELEDTEL